MRFRNPFSSDPVVIDNSTGQRVNPDKPEKNPDVKGRCNHRWGKTPQNPRPGGHYEHWCGLLPNHRSVHVCNAKWECGETDG